MRRSILKYLKPSSVEEQAENTFTPPTEDVHDDPDAEIGERRITIQSEHERETELVIEEYNSHATYTTGAAHYTWMLNDWMKTSVDELQELRDDIDEFLDADASDTTEGSGGE